MPANDTERDLQKLLDGLYTWCNNNNMTINDCKSNAVHFRLPSMERSKYIFKCGDMNIEVKNNYTYLGLILNEFLGSMSNRPQTKSAPSQIGPKSNRYQVKSAQVKSAPDQIIALLCFLFNS